MGEPLLPLVASCSSESLLVPLAAPPTPTPLPAPLANDAAASSAASPAAAATRTAQDGGAPAAAAAQCPVLADVRVHLCMATFSLGVPVDAAALGQAMPNVELAVDCKRQGVTVSRLREPSWVAKVMPTGKVKVFTNYDGEPARTAAKRLARLIQTRFSASVAFKHYQIRTVQVGARVAFRIDTDGFARFLAQGTAPPPAGFRLADCSRNVVTVEVDGDRKRTVRIHKNGTLKVHDAMSLAEGAAAMEKLLPMLSRHNMWW